MMVVVQTQYMENYGYSSGTEFWKPKGGYEYKITNVPEDADQTKIFKAAIRLIEYTNPMSREYVVGTVTEPDNYLSRFERDQLEFDGRIDFPEKVIPYEDLPYLLMAKDRDENKMLEEIE